MGSSVNFCAVFAWVRKTDTTTTSLKTVIARSERDAAIPWAVSITIEGSLHFRLLLRLAAGNGCLPVLPANSHSSYYVLGFRGRKRSD